MKGPLQSLETQGCPVFTTRVAWANLCPSLWLKGGSSTTHTLANFCRFLMDLSEVKGQWFIHVKHTLGSNVCRTAFAPIEMLHDIYHSQYLPGTMWPEALWSRQLTVQKSAYLLTGDI